MRWICDSLLSYCDPGAHCSQVERLNAPQPGVVLLRITGVTVRLVTFSARAVLITVGLGVVWPSVMPTKGDNGWGHLWPFHGAWAACILQPFPKTWMFVDPVITTGVIWQHCIYFQTPAPPLPPHCMNLLTTFYTSFQTYNASPLQMK